MRVRSGYSFHTAAGHLPDVMARLQAIGYPAAPLSDRVSTFGFTRWTKLAAKAGLKPIYGVELAVIPSFGDDPAVDMWSFFAIESLRPLHDLIFKATSNPGKFPCLSMDQALGATGCVRMAGERLVLERLPNQPVANFYVGLSPSTPRGLVRAAQEAGIPFLATSDNYYPAPADQEFYRIALGSRRANTQTYPMHMLSDEEWRDAVPWPELHGAALANRDQAMELCHAQQRKATLLKPEKKQTLREMCLSGAQRKSVNLEDPVYAARLDRELQLIAEKEFEDYFYILADIIGWAKQRMIVGPARGSSCGSLVCYLLDITAIDPIPYGLIFERFIDINRKDLPDIDVDFSDTRRHLVFDYVEKRYGHDKVARLGTVGMFKARSALKQAGASLRIPGWRTDKVLDSLIERSSGDSRAMNTLEDTLNETDAGRKLLQEHPEVLIAARMEGHPNNASQHAAGVIVTNEPIREYVAVDARTRAIMADKKDSEDLNLLKIDALGLTQLSIFERTIELLGDQPTTAWLERIPLDDQKAFDVLNSGHFSGIFQFTGTSVRALAGQIDYRSLDDIIATTAIARPGPLGSGGALAWVRRRSGDEPVSTIHPMLTDLTRDTYGVVIYQETVMRIVREMGQMSWEDTSAIRKAMSGRLGDEFFERYWQKFLVGAVANGVDDDTARTVWRQINTMGSWSFNKCIAGSEKVKLSRGNSSGEATIAELYEKYEIKPSAWMRRKNSKPWLISMDASGLGFPQKAVRIHKNGFKRCIRLEFSDNTSVVCTPDHKFIINGVWMQAGAAKAGAIFAALKDHKTPYKKTTGKGHAKGRRWTIGPDGDRSGPANVAWTTGVKAVFDEFVRAHRGAPCEICSRRLPRMEAHHLDLDRGRTDPQALQWLCPSCHKKAHYNSGRSKQWERGKQPATKVLVSITDAGMVDTYDIEMPEHHNFMLANGLVTHNSHAVAYGIVSYWCAWFKAHHPIEFAAATLDAEAEPARQLAILRELKAEGVDYVPVDPELSDDRWRPAVRDGRQMLIGPLTSIKGIGPAKLSEIIDCRRLKEPLRPQLRKLLDNAQTPIDSLYPIGDRVKELHPDLSAIKIVTEPTPIIEVQPGAVSEVLIIGVLKTINPRDENEAINVQKRGGKILTGPTQSLNLFVQDDTDEVFCKIDRFSFEEKGRAIVETAKAGRSLYAIKGRVPRDFRMVKVTNVRYLGEMN